METAPCKGDWVWDFLIEKAFCKGISLVKRLVVNGLPYSNVSLQSDFAKEKALSTGISFWNNLFVEWFLYGKSLFVKGIPFGKGSLQRDFIMETVLCKGTSFGNMLFVEWFLYLNGHFVKGIYY
jgi:hypothetical protein